MAHFFKANWLYKNSTIYYIFFRVEFVEIRRKPKSIFS